MKARLSALFVALAAISVAPAALSAGPGFAIRPAACCTAPLPASISAEETSTLLWMREEEKVARDLYRNLAERWQDRLFGNIAGSEQRHFDAVGARITAFGLTDPALPAVGVFANPELQAVYDTLLTSGQASFIGALTVGATVEDLDIRDLVAALETTTNPALQTTYRNLLEGSKSHLRAFVSRLRAFGQEYTPQYMDPVLFESIVGH